MGNEHYLIIYVKDRSFPRKLRGTVYDYNEAIRIARFLTQLEGVSKVTVHRCQEVKAAEVTEGTEGTVRYF